VKVYRVINGEIDVQERDIEGPYFNNNTHLGNVRKKTKNEKPKETN
jgi:hypothetical protein